MTPQVRLATLLVGSPAIAEAVVQEAFASVRERWADLERPDAHLRTSVVNGCTGILRRRTIEQRYRAARIEVADSELPEQLIDLRGALDRLTDRQRLVVVLRHFADLPDEEIAEALDSRPATVRSLAYRALAALRRGAAVSTQKDGLRRDLPALADALREASSARHHETADSALEASGVVAELDSRPVGRPSRWPLLADGQLRLPGSQPGGQTSVHGREADSARGISRNRDHAKDRHRSRRLGRPVDSGEPRPGGHMARSRSRSHWVIARSRDRGAHDIVSLSERTVPVIRCSTAA